MKKHTFATTVLFIPLAVVSASAATISISNLVDGPPTIITDVVGPTITVGFEETRISLSLLLGTAPAIPVGTRSVIMSEPASDPLGPRISDFITITASPALQGIQGVTLFFQSDGAVGFDASVAALAAGAPSVVETGALQDLSGPNLLNTFPGLTINVASDIAGPEVPEPSTWALMGAALLAILTIRKNRDQRRAWLG